MDAVLLGEPAARDGIERAQCGARHAAGGPVDQGVGARPLQLKRLERESRADVVDGDMVEGVHERRAKFNYARGFSDQVPV